MSSMLNRIMGTDKNDTLFGSSGDDLILPGTGQISLPSSLFSNIVFGSEGDDIIDGSVAHFDLVTYQSLQGPVSINLEAGTATKSTISASSTLPGNISGIDQLIDILAAEGSDYNDSLIGAKSELGGFLRGGKGDDLIDNNGGHNKLDYARASGAVSVNLTLARASGADGNDTLVGHFSSVLGSDYADTIIGDKQGGAIAGGKGNDSLVGTHDDSYTSLVGYLTATGSVTVDLQTGRASGADGNDRFYGFDGAIGSTFNDVLRGSVRRDNLYGFDGNDRLDGRAENDTLDGGLGNDTLIGGAGDDVMFGGTGNDVYFVDSTNDFIREYAGEGLDRVYSSATYTLSNNVEQLFLNGTVNINGTGNALANYVVGNGASNILVGLAGDDTLLGGAGDDSVFGGEGNDNVRSGSGNDVIDGGDGVDTVDYSGDPERDHNVRYSGIVLSLSDDRTFNGIFYPGHTALDGYGNTDTLINVENVVGSNFDDLIGGSEANNTLSGLNGTDYLAGAAGNDSLVGGNGTDWAVYQGKFEDYSIVWDAAKARWTVTDLSNRTGIYNDGIDTLSGIEILQFLEGNRFIWLTSATLSGLDSSDWISGGFKNDWLSGGLGDDTLNGFAGNDTLISGAGNDLIDGGAGIDTVDYSKDPPRLGQLGGIKISLSDDRTLDGVFYPGHTALDGYGNIDTVLNVENVIGSSYDDLIGGSEFANSLSGGDGFDIFAGGAGNDTIDGGNDRDWAVYQGSYSDYQISWNANSTVLTVKDKSTSRSGIYNDGTDTLRNVETLQFLGDHRIVGVAANNTLGGTSADDLLTGGTGSDQFVFYAGAGKDTVTNFNANSGISHDTLTVYSYTFADWNDLLSKTKQVGSDLVITASPNDVLTLKNVAINTFTSDDVVFK